MAETVEKFVFIKDTTNKSRNLTKMTLVQLKEVLEREENLLKNKRLLSKLPDKGNSIKTFVEQVKKVIADKESIEALATGLENLNLSTNEDKHVQKICNIETIPNKDRYKPFSTLNKSQELHTDRKVFKVMEDWSKCNKPTKLIPLGESLDILKKQEGKIKEEQLRVRNKLLLRLDDDSDDLEDDVSDDEEYS